MSSHPTTLSFPVLDFSPSIRLPWNQVTTTLRNCLNILYLFTYSDYKTVLIPVTAFAYFSAHHTSPYSILCSCFWTWFHLLQVCVSNQSLDLEEDALNKPWRPIPSRLISVTGARILRWILLPLCISLSAHLGTHWHSISLALASVVYNELGFNSYGIIRDVCNAWAYASFNAGAAMIAAGESTLNMRSAISVAVNTLIILTTIHSQDFRDQKGDERAGRRTIPMVWPEGSRISILVTLMAWSVGLSWACGLSYPVSMPFCALGGFIGLRFFRERTADEDKQSFHYYTIWLVVAQVVHTPAVMSMLSHL